MRVCFVSPYPLGMVSGISTLLLDLSDELRRKGHAGTFLGPAGDVRDPPMALMDIRLGPKEGTVALARRTARALRDAAGRFDLVHVQQPHPQTWAAARVARSLGIPVVSTFHLKPPPSGRRLRRLADRIAERNLLQRTRMVFVSEHTRKDFGAPSGTVIPNGVGRAVMEAADLSKASARAALGIGGKEFVFLFAGRQTRNKGYGELLRAMAGLKGRTFLCLATGEAPPAEAAGYRALEAGLPRFRNLGRLDRSDWIQAALASDAFLLPSHIEGMPMVLLEAMAFRLAPIVTAVGGVPEVVGRDEAVFVEAGDADGLARAMGSLLDRPEEASALGKRARRRLEQGFTMETCARRYEAVYADALNPGTT